jgi:hypothetical protein
MAGGLSVALSGLPETGERLTLAGLLATAFLLWPFARNLLAHTEGLSLVAKRKAALLREEARLMAGDATRPGGAVGGDPVGPGIPYVPPSLSQYRAGH